MLNGQMAANGNKETHIKSNIFYTAILKGHDSVTVIFRDFYIPKYTKTSHGGRMSCSLNPLRWQGKTGATNEKLVTFQVRARTNFIKRC